MRPCRQTWLATYKTELSSYRVHGKDLERFLWPEGANGEQIVMRDRRFVLVPIFFGMGRVPNRTIHAWINAMFREGL